MGLAIGLDGASEWITESNWCVILLVEDEEGDVLCVDRDMKRVGSSRRGCDRGSISNIANSPVCAKAC